MSWFVSYVRSSVGAKHVMAVTGLGLLLFAIIHMLGHLGMFAGRDAYNHYAHTLQGLGALKWIARGGLLFLVAVHIGAGVRLASLNRAARPVKYAVYRTVRTRPWAKWMPWTGLLILAFIVYHLVHFTFGQIQPEYFHKLDPQGRYDAYTMFVRGFQNTGILISYLVAMALLLPHLAHGISSTFQSLGLKHPKYDGLIDKAGPALAVIMFLGYIAPPIAVALHVIKLPGA
ncbi:MAG: succinate dehydrogenase cytochrome b subunit [Kofleriaceae bacterium]|nr:succinate dehydrogenase cytochrome b subunit [Myxococcales bacterium]MCB9565075.1 succinate dehydrogenase cytochrome b subunit [Kofleriaceae bacterium]